jgi:Tol biopolymer transport system component
MTILKLIPIIALSAFGCADQSPTSLEPGTAAVHVTESPDWGSPQNLGAGVNSSSSELQVGISPNGKTLYFSSDRAGTYGSQDLWVSHLQSGGTWDAPVNLGAVVNSTALDSSPTVSIDGHWLYFSSRRAGGLGGLDCWRAYRVNVEDDFGWEPPENLGAAVNSTFDDADCLIRRDELGHETLWFTSLNRPAGKGDWDIYTSAIQDDGSFAPATPVTELNTAARDTRMTLSGDGRTIIFTSNRAGGVGGIDMWMAERPSPNRPFCEPVDLTAINSTANDRSPSMTTNGAQLYFTSTRSGGLGSDDLYVVALGNKPAGLSCPPHGE